jgi:hypothetical protein
MLLKMIFIIQCFTLFMTPSFLLAKPVAITPLKQDNEVVLFNAKIHDLDTISNYTASWREGSNIIPVARKVIIDATEYVEFSFKGDKGMACSTIYFDNIPAPDEGMKYAGIKFLIGYDKDDYGKVSVNTTFSDNTLVVKVLTLDEGIHEYSVKSGFRRADFPPKWELLKYIMLNVNAEDSRDLKYRISRITLIQEKKRPAEPMNEYQFGQRVFCPQPKKILWKEGEFLAGKQSELFIYKDATKRTMKTGEIFREKYHGYTGSRLTTKEFDSEIPNEGIILRIEDSAIFDNRLEKLREEGYCLEVDKERIIITGFDEPGLYYGAVTLFQLMKGSMKIERNMPVPCVQILDWPDLHNRLCRLEHTHNFRNREIRENRGIDYLIDWTDRFVAGNKLNFLFLDISAVVKYKRRPELNGSEKLYSLEDIKRFGQFCRDNFVEVCPAWQVGSHGSWWLLVGYYPQLREKGWRAQTDVTHPEHDEIVFDCMLDVIEALQPKYLSPKSDEWWHSRKEGETPDDLLHGKTRAQAFLDFHIKLNNWLREKGITMMIFHDMLSPYHNGKRYDVYKVIDDFPKNVIISIWSSGDLEKQARYFSERGFEVWINATGMFTPNEEVLSIINGYGKGMYSWGQYKIGLLDKYSGLSSQYALFRAADYAWNASTDSGEGVQPQVESGRLVTIRNIFSVDPNPYAGYGIEPIDISGAMTHSFTELLKDAKPEEYAGCDKVIELNTGASDIGFIPTRITGDDEKNCIALFKNAEDVTIPVAGKYSSLIFLHTAYIVDPSDPGAQGASNRKWPYGWPCGNYAVRYSDGERIVIPLRLPINIKRFDTTYFNRATNENRYIHVLKDCKQNNIHLFQMEWVNPRPEQMIQEIVFYHDNELDVAPILMAISGRSVRKN